MLSTLACYTQAGSLLATPRALELVDRTTLGLMAAEVALDATIERLTESSLHPWSAPAGDLTLLHTQRIAKQSWEYATAFLDATVQASSSGEDLSQEEYRLCDQLSDDATRIGLQAVQMAAAVAQGKNPPNTRVQPAPKFGVNTLSYEGVWAAVATIIDGVELDLIVLERNMPTHFVRLHESLVESMQPALQTYSYLRSQWIASTAPSNRQQIARDVQPLVDGFYRLMQQLWAPYLLGAPYVGLLKSEVILGPLKLGIDPWMLTDPSLAPRLAASQADCRALAEFWRTVADPRQVVPLQRDITEALRNGSLRIVDGQTLKIAPWYPKYKAVRPVNLDGRDIPAGRQFTLYPKGGSGKRTIELRVI